LYSVKVLDHAGNGTYAQVIQGIEWAIEHHVNVISMSFTGASDSQALHQAIVDASNAGILMIAAAGNRGSGAETEMYPALYPEVVSVGATTPSNVRANLSSTGNELDIMAPGVDIYSTFIGGGYTYMSGTSMAVPYVTGAAAVLWSAYPDDDSLSIMNRIYASATPLGDAHEYGHGLVNLARALGLVDSAIPAYQPGAEDGTSPEQPGDHEVSATAVVRGDKAKIWSTAPSTKPSYTKVDIGVDSPSGTRVCSKTYTATIAAGSIVPVPELMCETASWNLGQYTVKYTFYYSGGTTLKTDYFTLTPENPTLSSSYTATRTSLSISWSAIRGVTQYKILKGGSLEATLGNVTSYTLTGLTAGTTYTIQVKAVDPSDSNAGATSSAVYMVTKPALVAPDKPTMTNITPNSFDAAWNAVSDVDQYKVLIDGVVKLTVTTTKATVTGLNPDQQYMVQVKAVDKYDTNAGATSVAAYVRTAKPAGPTNLTATYVTSSKISVSWSPISGATAYTVAISRSGSSETLYQTSAASYTFSNLDFGVVYKIRVYTSTSAASEITIATDAKGTLPDSIPLKIDGQTMNAYPLY